MTFCVLSASKQKKKIKLLHQQISTDINATIQTNLHHHFGIFGAESQMSLLWREEQLYLDTI